MVELRGGRRLTAESRKISGRRQIASQEHFDGHRAAEAFLDRPIDHTHAAAADLLEQFIVAERERERCNAGQHAGARRRPRRG